MSEAIVGRVLSIALRSPDVGPMREVPHADAVVDAGLTGDVRSTVERGITLISARQWTSVNRELSADLPWHTRRANVLVDAEALGQLIGRTIRIGSVEVAVLGETKPCGLMDKLHNGLRAALVPDCRGGVRGRILTSGRIAVGDEVCVVS